MTTLLYQLPLAVLLAGLLGCQQRFSSDALTAENFAAPSSSGALDAGLVPSGVDAGAPPLESSHAMTVTSCSSSPQACGAPEADAAARASYRVVFGSGRAEIRSRGQAMADVYQQLRDRTVSGERLDAEPRASGAAEAPAARGVGSAASTNTGGSDPVAEGAFRLLDLVDRTGEVTLDIVHGLGSKGCTVSLGRSADGGSSQCLIREPERGQGPDRKGPGVSW
jgi:hypothetical protein